MVEQFSKEIAREDVQNGDNRNFEIALIVTDEIIYPDR